ncbi:solute carrier family 26 member 6-like [Toxorhynchites rutilus septentrionalis]|uniref:solute carrier family 26 member 6-like n=1 Tax=Toxorhynchites rutilus septentrionalis TaxID=329112 RepID=UPI0024796160|nr:solute carrier family 26 member 6-like [Toxorhynchites rutilus septentrionalis]
MLYHKAEPNDGNKLKSEYSELSYLVTRQCLNQEDLNQLTEYDSVKTSALDSVTEGYRSFNFSSTLLSFIPILQWLPKYSFGENFFGDFTTGITVAVMQIPQGMACALLAGVPANVGLYMAFFHSLTYAIFGTSKHVSMGTFAVLSLMTAKVVQTYATVPMIVLNETYSASPEVSHLEPHYTPIQVVTALSLIVGCYHILMRIFRLGTLTSLLSEPLVSGFTTAAAVDVLISQMKDLLGMSVPRHSGIFKNILTLRDVIERIPNSNPATVYTSLAVIVFMVVMNEYLKPWSATRCRFPIPTELMVVVGGTLASYAIGLGPNHDVLLVGEIHVGLPAPQLPPVMLLEKLAVDAISIAIVSYSVVMSMGMIFAQKEGYEVCANQELVAMGITNIIGSFFSCIPTACSLSRSLIQHQAGGKTQLTAVISSMLILVVVLWLGPYFEVLPQCVLSSIIFIALKGMLWQFQHIKKFYREGGWELAVWLLTFFSVTILNIDLGLLIGVVFSVTVLYVKGWKSYYSLLGTIPESAIYVNIAGHRKAEEVPHIKIFRYTGAINFASRTAFKKTFVQVVGVRGKLGNGGSGYGATEKTISAVIVDLSSVPHIDLAACKTLNEIRKEMAAKGVNVLVAHPADCVYDMLLHAESLGEGGFHIFPTIHDAVLYAQGGGSVV